MRKPVRRSPLAAMIREGDERIAAAVRDAKVAAATVWNPEDFRVTPQPEAPPDPWATE